MNAAALMALTWGFEVIFGWPDSLYRRIRHPVVWFGGLVSWLERRLNRTAASHAARYGAGALSTLVAVAVATVCGLGIATLLPDTVRGFAVEALIASSLIASRSLYAHVAAVARPMAADKLGEARAAVSMIVGRDPSQLDAAGINRAALESLAENASDGVIAPLFWGALFGLPGLAAYKAINTLDSMIGHRTPRYAAYGGFAARLDDVANYIPARLTGLLIALASASPRALALMVREARQHRSPNAGWPEAAMAGGLNVRLSGPRLYSDRVSEEPWLNGGANDPTSDELKRGLALYRRAMMLGAGGLIAVALLWAR
ncbi:MAG: adenosylcobinamide-phosphate synthase CbiB [Pseudomonadota bacterium]